MRRDSVTRSIFDSDLIKKFVIHSIAVSFICIAAIVVKYVLKVEGFIGDIMQFIVKIYKFPAYYAVESLGGDVEGMRLFFYLLIDMLIISIVTFFIKVITTGELRKEIDEYTSED